MAAIELNEYNLDCPHCKEVVTFKISQVEGLGDDIEDEQAEIVSEVERQFEGQIEPENAVDPRLLHDLSAAIRAGDRQEAEYQLNKLAAELGPIPAEWVERGRYSVKVAA